MEEERQNLNPVSEKWKGVRSGKLKGSVWVSLETRN